MIRQVSNQFFIEFNFETFYKFLANSSSSETQTAKRVVKRRERRKPLECKLNLSTVLLHCLSKVGISFKLFRGCSLFVLAID